MPTGHGPLFHKVTCVAERVVEAGEDVAKQWSCFSVRPGDSSEGPLTYATGGVGSLSRLGASFGSCLVVAALALTGESGAVERTVR